MGEGTLISQDVLSRLEPELAPNNVVFERVIDALNADKPIVYSKINHGFWERLVALEAEGFDLLETDAAKTYEMDHLAAFRRPTPFMFEGGFAREILSDLKNYPPAGDTHIFSAGLLGWPKRLEVAGLSENQASCQAMIKRCVPDIVQTPDADGMEFKWALITGAYARFAQALRGRDCLLVGNKNLARYFDFMGVEQGRFMEVHASQARADRDQILNDILAALDENPSLKTILLQAGGSLSAWLIFRLHQRRPDVSLIDIGLGALICNPAVIFPTAFGRVYRRQLGECMDKIHLGWRDQSLPPVTQTEIATGRSEDVVALLDVEGVSRPTQFFDSQMTLIKPLALTLKPPRDDRRITHMNDTIKKPRSFARDLLKDKLSLSEEEEIILCRSRGVAEEIALRAMPELQDANIYQVHDIKDWNKIRTRAFKQPTYIFVDNHIGCVDRPKLEKPKTEIEILNFDETTPWGVGEATLLICSKELAELIRGFVNDHVLLSEIECASLIECFERYDRWAIFYNRQRRRIAQLMAQNFDVFEPINLRCLSPVSSFSYYCNQTVSDAVLKNPFFELKLRTDKIMGADDARPIIEIPCHPYMRHISNADFIATIRQLIQAD